MPRSNPAQTRYLHPREDSKKESLGNIGITDSQSQLGLLKYILKGIEKGDKEIYKGLFRCGEWNSNVSSEVVYTGYKDKRITIKNIHTCKNPDCPVCSLTKATERTKRLSMALQEARLQGCEVMFITATARPMSDVKISIDAVLEYNKLAKKTVNNYTRKYDSEDKGMFYSRIETPFSTTKCSIDSNGEVCDSFVYIHAHSHILVCIPKKVCQDRGTKLLVERLKALWVRTCEKYGIYTLVSKRAEKSAGFRCDYVDNTDKMSLYINKVMGADKLAMEMNYTNMKKGQSLPLPVLLTMILNEPNNSFLKLHYKTIRTYFTHMFGKRNRVIEDRVSNFISMFKERQERLMRSHASLYCNNDDAIDSLIERWKFIQEGRRQVVRVLFDEGVNTYFEEDSLSPTKITGEILDTLTRVFQERVPAKIYNALRKRGYEDTLLRLFYGYHFDDMYRVCYGLYERLSVRWNDTLFDKFIYECRVARILIGSSIVTKKV